jgi:DNA-binding Lrp family transcriptional regulator
MIGLVSINVEIGKFDEVAETLGSVEEVQEVYGVYGDVDLLALVETKGEEYLSDVVLRKIQNIPGIRTTATTVLIPIKRR